MKTKTRSCIKKQRFVCIWWWFLLPWRWPWPLYYLNVVIHHSLRESLFLVRLLVLHLIKVIKDHPVHAFIDFITFRVILIIFKDKLLQTLPEVYQNSLGMHNWILITISFRLDDCFITLKNAINLSVYHWQKMDDRYIMWSKLVYKKQKNYQFLERKRSWQFKRASLMCWSPSLNMFCHRSRNLGFAKQ